MRKWIIACSGILTLSFLSSCGSTAKLSFNPKVGESYHYMSNTEMDMAMMSMNIEMNVKTYFALNVMEKADTTFHIKMSYDSLMISQSNPMSGKIEYNSNTYDEGSADQSTKMIAGTLEELKNKEFDAWVSSSGHLIKLEGADNLGDAGGMMQGTDPSGIIKSVVIAFPGGELKEGQNWTVKQSSGSIGIESTVTYTIKSIGSDEIVLDMSTSIPENQEMESNGVSMTISNFSSTGEVTVERKTGMLLEMHTKQSMDMQMNMQGMDMTATTESTTDIKRLD